MAEPGILPVLTKLRHVFSQWSTVTGPITWQWRHNSALLVLCEGNPPVTGGFSSQRPVMWKAFPYHHYSSLTLHKRCMALMAHGVMELASLTSIFWTSWWRHQMETFSALLALCAGNSPVLVNSSHKGQWRGALMFSLIYAWINDWVTNREAGDLRRQRGHYDVIVMLGLLWLVIFHLIWLHTKHTNVTC